MSFLFYQLSDHLFPRLERISDLVKVLRQIELMSGDGWEGVERERGEGGRRVERERERERERVGGGGGFFFFK